jgi:hypothetical protein
MRSGNPSIPSTEHFRTFICAPLAPPNPHPHARPTQPPPNPHARTRALFHLSHRALSPHAFSRLTSWLTNPTGTFQAASNMPACDAISNCSRGTQPAVDPTPSSNRVCTACPPGTFQPNSNIGPCLVALTCLPGQYQLAPHNATYDTTCAALTICLPGQETDTLPTATSDRTCRACQPGVCMCLGVICLCFSLARPASFP